MIEFTGERVVPGEVDDDLWNEHLSRYLFATRLARGKTLVDVGCGTGYGSAELAHTAARVIGLDQSRDAVSYAAQHYSRHNLQFLTAAATDLPFANSTFDLIVAFEVIEHLEDWQHLLLESRRVLRPTAQLVISTPNRDFYAESRRQSGPNPYHHHEFSYSEFVEVLKQHFSHVTVFLQNHSPSITFQPIHSPTGADVRVGGEPPNPEESNFFVAVCAATPQTGSPAFVHIPTTANVLGERNRHIDKLEQELAAKNTWLEETKRDHQELLRAHRDVNRQLEQSNQWADQLNAELASARDKLERFHAEKDSEIANLTAGYDQVIRGYEKKIADLEAESEKHSRWAMETHQELESKITELAHCVEALHRTEADLRERTTWAQSLDVELEELRARLAMLEASRWVRLGRAVGLGPRIEKAKQ